VVTNIFLVINMAFFFAISPGAQNFGVVPGFWDILCTLYTNVHGIVFQKPLIFKFTNTRVSKSHTNISVKDREILCLSLCHCFQFRV
jgi:hypothetical protein